jgi:hypothetical protein
VFAIVMQQYAIAETEKAGTFSVLEEASSYALAQVVEVGQ